MLKLFLVLLSTPVFAFYHCFYEAGERFGVDPYLLASIAKVESNFNPRALNINKNRTKDYGIMQINSYWVERYKLPVEWLFEPCYNIHMGAMVLKRCMHAYPNSLAHAIDCYNKGSKAKGHSAYVEKVYKNYKRIRSFAER